MFEVVLEVGGRAAARMNGGPLGVSSMKDLGRTLEYFNNRKRRHHPMDNLVRAFPPLAVPLAVAGSAGYVLGKLRHKDQRHRQHHAEQLAAEVSIA